MRSNRLLALAVLVPLAGGGAIAGASAEGAAKDPQRLLKASAASLSKVRSYHLALTETDTGDKFAFTADIASSGNANIVLRPGGQGTLMLRRVGSTTYLRGDSAYWKASGGKDGDALATKLAGRWITASRADAKDFDSLFTDFAPKHLGHCLGAPAATGTLTAGRSATYAGHKVDVLIDAGDKPGTSPGKLFIAASGAPLPLRAVQTGKVKPGGKTTECTDADDTSTSSEIRFSRYNEKLTIKAPTNAIEDPGTGGGTTAS